ncbi:hypothetical protein [Ferrithrix thermotolerans]|uniref:hypothetical protein n=1 Tax=Ferrithrix thermotolerans TaxID=209649 RepID=UPI001160CBED|nr:hypothetical protein [Ferrithrix thermotolerans]
MATVAALRRRCGQVSQSEATVSSLSGCRCEEALVLELIARACAGAITTRTDLLPRGADVVVDGSNSWQPRMLDYGLVNRRDWALANGIHPHTAFPWYREGKLPVPARKMGKLILVSDLAISPTEPGVRSKWPAGRRLHDRPDADQDPGCPRR